MIDKYEEELLLLLLVRVNEVWCQLWYHHQTRANFVIYNTSINNSDSDSHNDSDSNSDSNNNSDYFNKGDSVKKICTQDKSGILVNHKIITI